MSVACFGFAYELGLSANARFSLFIRLLLSINAGAQKDAIDDEDGCRLQEFLDGSILVSPEPAQLFLVCLQVDIDLVNVVAHEPLYHLLRQSMGVCIALLLKQ